VGEVGNLVSADVSMLSILRLSSVESCLDHPRSAPHSTTEWQSARLFYLYERLVVVVG
jgi:hypothetical protein